MMAFILPVIPSAGLKGSVLGALGLEGVGAARGGAAAGAGLGGATGLGAVGTAVAGAPLVGTLAKLAVAGALIGGAGVAGKAVDDEPSGRQDARPASATARRRGAGGAALGCRSPRPARARNLRRWWSPAQEWRSGGPWQLSA